MDEPPDRGDLDPRTAEAVEQAYAERVELDTAARHLWVLYRSAGAVETAPRVAEREQPADDAPSEGGSRRQLARMRHVALSVLTAATVLATSGGAVAASGSAMPGDALYALKRGTEQVRLVIATGGTEAQMRVELARERWTEAKRVVADRPEVVPGLVRDAVEALEAAEAAKDSEGQVAEEAGSVRQQLVDESPVVAADLDGRGREDVQTSMNRLAGPETADVAGRNEDSGEVTTTEAPEAGVEDGAVTPSAPGGESDAVEEDGEAEPADQGGEAGDQAEGEGAENPPSGEAPEGREEETVDPSGDGGDTAGDVAEEALETDEMAVDDQQFSPDGESVAPGTEEGLDLGEEAQREEDRDGGPSGPDTAEREAATGASGQSGEADGEAAEPHSSPTLSPDPTQQHVSGTSG